MIKWLGAILAAIIAPVAVWWLTHDCGLLKPCTPPPASTTTPEVAKDSCAQNFVWREASPQDHVCVTPATRQQTADDNRQASTHIAPRPGVPDACATAY